MSVHKTIGCPICPVSGPILNSYYCNLSCTERVMRMLGERDGNNKPLAEGNDNNDDEYGEDSDIPNNNDEYALRASYSQRCLLRV
jgi:hypothetical protein